jgi:copper chaperone CopZ
MNDLSLSVPGITCGHCATAIRECVTAVPGVTGVEVDIAGRQVRVTGRPDPAAVRTAIADAGYQAA